MPSKKVQQWINQNVPDQSGKTFVITGANSGLGFETTAVLANKGAKVVMACRNLDKANLAADQIRARVPNAQLETMQVDVASLASIKSFAADCLLRHPKIDVLINNAGIMGVPKRELTEDGFERQFGTNHLGAFALTMQLLPALEAADAGRVIATSSIAHRNTKGLNLDDLNFEQAKYSPFDAYAKSKLANVLFTMELNNRLHDKQSKVIAASGHPGYSASNIGSASNPSNSAMKAFFFDLGNQIAAMPTEKGALSILYAATSPNIKGGEFIGPTGPMGFWGWPDSATPSETGTDPISAKKLWEISERFVGFTLPNN